MFVAFAAEAIDSGLPFLRLNGRCIGSLPTNIVNAVGLVPAIRPGR